MSESRWTNVYPAGRGQGALMHRSRADADAAAGPDDGRLYVLRYDLDDEDDRDEITREPV